MKKQLSLIAIAAGTIVLASAPSFAQVIVPITTTEINAAKAPTASGNAEEFQVSGTIDEFVQITSIDDTLELNNLGGPENNQTVYSTSGSGVGVGNFTQGTTGTGNGTAGVEGRSNAYIKIEATYGADLKNLGPNGVAGGGDDYELQTRFRVAGKGNFTFAPTQDSSDLGNYSTNGSTATTYSGYSPAVDAGTTGYITFAPGEANGAKVMAEVDRNGLNDYKGTYSTQINLNYFKF